MENSETGDNNIIGAFPLYLLEDISLYFSRVRYTSILGRPVVEEDIQPFQKS